MPEKSTAWRQQTTTGNKELAEWTAAMTLYKSMGYECFSFRAHIVAHKKVEGGGYLCVVPPFRAKKTPRIAGREPALESGGGTPARSAA